MKSHSFTYIMCRWALSLGLAAGGVICGFAAARIGDWPLVAACGVVVIVATLWQWDRDQEAEVEAAERRSNAISEALQRLEGDGNATQPSAKRQP